MIFFLGGGGILRLFIRTAWHELHADDGVMVLVRFPVIVILSDIQINKID